MKILSAMMLISALIASQTWAMNENALFICIQRDYVNCFNEQAGQFDTWRGMRNNDGESALVVAIKNRSVNVIKAMIDSDVQVSITDLHLAMREFFAVEPEFFDMPNVTHFKKALVRSYSNIKSPARDIMQAITKDHSDDDLGEIATALSVLTSRNKISLLVSGAVLSGDLSPHLVKRLLRHHRALFLLGKPITAYELRLIVYRMLPIGMERFVLALVTDAFEQFANYHLQRRKLKKFVCESASQQKARYLSAAIMEMTRLSMLNFGVKDIVREVSEKKNNQALEYAITFQNRLIAFVANSILSRKSTSSKLRRYELWHHVYVRLLDGGDLASALSVAVGLNNSEVSRAILKFDQKVQCLANLGANYKLYRAALSSVSSEFVVPSLVVIKKDITRAHENGLFIDEQGHARIDMEALRVFAKLNREYEKYQRSINNNSIKSAPALLGALGDLPDVEIDITDPKFTAAERAIFDKL